LYCSSNGTKRTSLESGNENPGPGMYNFKGFADEVVEKAKKFKRPQYMRPIMEESNKKERNDNDNEDDEDGNYIDNNNNDNAINNDNNNQEQNEDQETIVLQTEE
jgi:hypothetical protein